MADDWFRWILGGLVAFYTAVTSWVVLTMFKSRDELHGRITKLQNEEIAALKERIVVLETRPYIDPIKYTEVVTKLTETVSSLTRQIADDIMIRHREHEELRKAFESLKAEVEELRRELLVPH